MIDTELELRESLHSLTTAAEPSLRAAGPGQIRQRHLVWRRRRNNAIAAVAAVLVLVVVVPVGVSLLTRGDGEVAGPGTAPSILDIPTRGSLAGDAEFLDGLRGRPLPPNAGVPSLPPPEDRYVAFAGDVPGGRWALLVDRIRGDYYTTWYVAEAGAGADQFLPVHPARLVEVTAPITRLADNDPLLDLPGEGTPGTLLVLTAPGDEVQVSERADVSSDGAVLRNYEPVHTAEGLALTQMRPSPYGPSASVRILRDGAEVYRGVSDPTAGGMFPGNVGASVRGQSGPAPSQFVVDVAVQSVLQPLGRSTDGGGWSYLWGGRVSGSPDQSVAIAGARAPSGGFLLGVIVGSGESGGDTEPGVVDVCLGAPLPGDPVLEAIPLIAACGVPVSDSADPSPTLVVSLPDESATRLVLRADDGTVLADQPMLAGSAAASLPDGAMTLDVLDLEGQVLRSEPVPPLAEPTGPYELGDYGDGLID